LYAPTRLVAASIARRVLPVPPGPVRVTRRAPCSTRESTLRNLLDFAPRKLDAGRGRFVFEKWS
jgi:hypothetical protein